MVKYTNKKLNNKGFSHLELLIVIIVVAIIAVIGYSVTQNRSKASTVHAGSYTVVLTDSQFKGSSTSGTISLNSLACYNGSNTVQLFAPYFSDGTTVPRTYSSSVSNTTNGGSAANSQNIHSTQYINAAPADTLSFSLNYRPATSGATTTSLTSASYTASSLAACNTNIVEQTYVGYGYTIKPLRVVGSISRALDPSSAQTGELSSTTVATTLSDKTSVVGQFDIYGGSNYITFNGASGGLQPNGSLLDLLMVPAKLANGTYKGTFYTKLTSLNTKSPATVPGPNIQYVVTIKK